MPRELGRYWCTDYDLHRLATRLNAAGEWAALDHHPWLYWENNRGVTAEFKQPPLTSHCRSRSACFPGQLFRAPRHWVERVYHNLISFDEVDGGRDFAA